MAGDADCRAGALRTEAQRLLAPLADLAAPVAPGAEPPWDQLVRIKEHEVRLAAQCGAALAYEGEFEGWRAVFARRRIGRAVLERMRRGATLDPGRLALAVVGDAAREGRDGLGQWLGTLGPGGVAAVVREATSFAVSARAAIEAWPPRGARFDPAAAFRWDVPGRAVRLEATADADAVHDGVGGAGARSLLLLATETAGDDAVRRELAWAALVCGLGTGRVPIRVTRIDLATGDRRTVPATDDVLDDGLTAAAAAVGAVMAVRFTTPSEPIPGGWCNRCRGLATCHPGEAWVASHIRRF
jgi:hypothetical protein